jgi:hypothetical protein
VHTHGMGACTLTLQMREPRHVQSVLFLFHPSHSPLQIRMMMKPNAAKMAEYEAINERWSKHTDEHLRNLEGFVEARRSARKREAAVARGRVVCRGPGAGRESEVCEEVGPLLGAGEV